MHNKIRVARSVSRRRRSIPSAVAQLVAASLVAGAELLGEAVAAEFRALRKRPVATIHKDGVRGRRQSFQGVAR
jgi:hypothetical protein